MIDQPGLEAIGRVIRAIGNSLHQPLQAQGRESINILRDRRQRGAGILTEWVIVVPCNPQVRQATNRDPHLQAAAITPNVGEHEWRPLV